MNIENARERRLEDAEAGNQGVQEIIREEVRKAMRKMKEGKAVGPDNIPLKAWRSLGELAMTWLFSMILGNERMPEVWRKSTLVPIFKNKSDV